MKDMIKRVREEKGGFTLAELLIVVAIILVLVAIAVPVFTGAMDKADESVQKADIRSAKIIGATKIMLDTATYGTDGPWKVTATVDSNGDVSDLKIEKVTNAGTDKAEPNDAGGYTAEVYVVATDLEAVQNGGGQG